ncbi:MAG: GNAT family N-acetyltransferase [Bacteroidetes bacterium]|nr:MAG: GNAT family N-acetyltransferase [Bacteroidota bacterium]
MTLRFNTKSFNNLSLNELYQLLKLRQDVFIIEQDCPYPELDNQDQNAWHLLGKTDDRIVAYLRIIPPKNGFLSIGRVAIDEHYRGRKWAYDLMQKGLETAFDKYGKMPVKITAQEYLVNFYKKLGFKPISEVYLDYNLPHVDMVLE